MKVVTIDCMYLYPRFAASFLITDGSRAAIVDNNTAHSVPRILDALAREGLDPEKVDYLIVTHVHLDHAGGSSALMERCPNAKLLAHPRAVPHLIDPSKLIKSAQEVYGEARFEELYGKIKPIDAPRIQAMADEEVLKWRGAELSFLHTRGHANHHFCIVLSEQGKAQAIFTGDSFGLAYPDLQHSGLFIFPSTSPTDFNADEARKSIRRILDSQAPIAYLTHFGGVDDLLGASKQLLEEIDFSERLLKEALDSSVADDQLQGFCEERVRKHFSVLFTKRGMRFDEKASKLLDLDLELNADGIAHVARKTRLKGTLK